MSAVVGELRHQAISSMVQKGKRQDSGVKAPLLFLRLCGTHKVVPS
jgi:hypothetical protein